MYDRSANLNIEEMHAKSNLLKLEDRPKLNLLKLEYTMKDKGFPEFELEPRNRNIDTQMTLRSYRQGNLRIEQSIFAKHEHSFREVSIKYSNFLPENIKIIDNIKLFCTQVYQEMLQNKLNFQE